MWATYWNALHEAGSRRVIVVLVGIAVVTAAGFNLNVGFSKTPDGLDVIYIGRQFSPSANRGPYPLGVPLVLGQQMIIAATVWFLLTIYAAVPLLISTLERGWLELTFSKATARWKIMLGRYLCGVTLYFLLAFIATAPLAARLWWITGVPTWQILIAVLIQTFSFAALLSIAALASLPQKGVALPIMAAAAIWASSPLLAARELNYYDFVTSEAGRRILDWVYYVLPKSSELNGLSSSFIQYSAVRASWPLWTTGLFTLATLVLTLSILQRKSF
jgi:hypothetical protein